MARLRRFAPAALFLVLLALLALPLAASCKDCSGSAGCCGQPCAFCACCAHHPPVLVGCSAVTGIEPSLAMPRAYTPMSVPPADPRGVLHVPKLSR